jgi:hypothetical protein
MLVAGAGEADVLKRTRNLCLEEQFSLRIFLFNSRQAPEWQHSLRRSRRSRLRVSFSPTLESRTSNETESKKEGTLR